MLSLHTITRTTMASEDQFTSIQWDRDEIERSSDISNNNNNNNNIDSIAEEPIESKPQEQGKAGSFETSQQDTTQGGRKVAKQVENQGLQLDAAGKTGATKNYDENNNDNGNDNTKSNDDNATNDNTDDDPSNSLLIASAKLSEGQIESSQDPATKSVDNDTNEQGRVETTSSTLSNGHGTNGGYNSIPDSAAETTTTVPVDTSYYDKYTIKVSATHPTRDLDASSKPFISYLVTTTTDNPSILKLTKEKAPKSGEQFLTFSVRRRYGDFKYLYESISNDFPTAMIPPLPSKLNIKYLVGDTFSHEFVHKRLHSLDRFLRFIIQHRELSQLSIFHLFISDSGDWNTFTTSLKIKELTTNGEPGGGGGIVNKVVNEDLLTEKVMNFLTSSKHKKETNREILEINDKLKKLYENLLKLDRIFLKLNRKNKELGIDYEQFSSQIQKLSIVQKDSVDENLSIASNFKVFAESLDYFLNSWNELHNYMDESFLVLLKDCSKYIINLTNLIELQHNKRIDLQVLQDYLNKSRNELGNLTGQPHDYPGTSASSYHHGGGSVGGGLVNNTTQLIKDTISTSATPYIGSTSSENKIHKLQNRIAQLEDEITLQTKLVNEFTNKIINDEYPNWDRFNKLELKDAMLGLCDKQIEFYSGLADNWTSIEAKLTRRLEELN